MAFFRGKEVDPMENLFRPSCITGKANTMTCKNSPKKTWELPKELEKFWQLWICRNQCFSGVFFRWFTQASRLAMFCCSSQSVFCCPMCSPQNQPGRIAVETILQLETAVSQRGTWTHPFPTEILPITWPKGWPQLFSYGFRDEKMRINPLGTTTRYRGI